MSLFEDWRKVAYSGDPNDRQVIQFWRDYFDKEKGIYEKLLDDVNKAESGTVAELAEKYGVDILTMTGFLDGINESIKTPNDVENLKEKTKVTLEIEPEKLYYNMVAAKADWLYNLSQWDSILTPERRKELYKEQKKSGTVIKPKKIGRNDPCPCGSGKKYKYCHGRTA